MKGDGFVKRWYLVTLILVVGLALALNGMCAFPGDTTLKGMGTAEFREGVLVNLAPGNGFDILKDFEVVINRKKFLPEDWRLNGGALVVDGKAGNLKAEVSYRCSGKNMTVEVSSPDKITELRFLVEPCDFEPLVIRGINRHFIQGRHAAYGFEMPGSRSFFMAGKFIIIARNVKEKAKLDVYVGKDLESVKRKMGLVKSESELSVVDTKGKPLPGVVVVENLNGKVVSAAQADENGKLKISLQKGVTFSLLWGEGYEIQRVNGSQIVVKAPENGWRWHPYISGADYNRVWVAFRTWRPTKGVVMFGGKEFSDNVIDTFHNIEIDGLKEGETGEAIVKAGDLEEKISLRTLKRSNIRFLVYGDTRTNESWHEMVCKDMAEENADFVIHTGDLVESGDLIEDWDKFFKAGRYLFDKVALFPTLGNHERNSALYYQAFTLRRGGGDFDKRWYSYTAGDIYFIVLDSNVSEESSTYKIETEWLENELKKAQSYKFTIVYFHHPFFTNSPNREPTLKEEWKKLLERYKVQLVLNGHIHHYERFLINGVMYVTTGGGGAPLGFGLLSANRTHIPGTEKGIAGFLHYIVAQEKKNGIEFTVKAVARYDWGKIDRSVEGKTLDEFFIPFR